jgi:hypothetical protein
MGFAGTGSKNSMATDPFVPRIALSLRLISSAGTRFSAKVHNNPLYRQWMLLALPFALVHRCSARWRAPWESNGETVLSHNSLHKLSH